MTDQGGTENNAELTASEDSKHLESGGGQMEAMVKWEAMADSYPNTTKHIHG